MDDTAYEAKQFESPSSRVGRSIDDRSPLEAGIVRLDELLAKLDHVGREHAERLFPILRPLRDEEDVTGLVRPTEMVSERVAQVHNIADRLEDSIDALQRLTARLEA